MKATNLVQIIAQFLRYHKIIITLFIKSSIHYLMGPQLGILQMFEGVAHVIILCVLDNSRTVLENVGERDFPCTAHVILQILPAGGCR